MYRNALNKRPDAYLICYAFGGRLFEGGRLFVGSAYMITLIVQVIHKSEIYKFRYLFLFTGTFYRPTKLK